MTRMTIYPDERLPFTESVRSRTSKVQADDVAGYHKPWDGSNRDQEKSHGRNEHRLVVEPSAFLLGAIVITSYSHMHHESNKNKNFNTNKYDGWNCWKELYALNIMHLSTKNAPTRTP
jgi:hypothetical protein